MRAVRHPPWPTPRTRTTSAALAAPVVTLASAESALQWTLCVALQLSRLHAQGLIHKALNPSNVMLNPLTGAVQWADLTGASVLATDRASADYNSHLHPPSAPLRSCGSARRAIDAQGDG